MPSDDYEINGETGTRLGRDTPVEDSTGKLPSFSFAVASNRTMSS
jgi:hypothetical protein